MAWLLVGILCSVSSSAETPLQAARRLYQAASRHYDLQEFDKALDEFKQAYETKDDPSLLFNIAQCQRSLGESEAALRTYKTYLVRAPNTPHRADVEARISSLEAAIAKTRSEQAMALEQAAADAAAAHPTPPATESMPPQTVANVVVETPPRKKPVYKQWWLWTTVGVVVVGVGLGVGLGLGLTRSHGQPVAPLETF